MNKGNEAMVYLSYIIDHYDGDIPPVVAFLHSHRGGFFEAWHVDTPLHSNVDAMRNLRLEHVQKQGYVNLRCNLNPGCKNLAKVNTHTTEEVWSQIFANTTTPFFSSHQEGPAAVSVVSSMLSNNDPGTIKSTCCAQFAVSREQIYQRPVEDYVEIRQWLLDTDLDNAHSGRVMEYLWHVIFGKEAVLCPDAQTCYCEVYGRC
jgi:hypothetical protein